MNLGESIAEVSPEVNPDIVPHQILQSERSPSHTGFDGRAGVDSEDGGAHADPNALAPDAQTQIEL